MLQVLLGVVFWSNLKLSLFARCSLNSQTTIDICNSNRNNFYLTWFESILNRPVGRVATRSSQEWEVWGSNLGPVKSDTVLPTARYRCDISSKGAVLPGYNEAEMGPANSLHASA